MTKGKRRSHSSGVKAKVVMTAIRRDKTLAKIAQQYNVDPNRLQNREKRLLSEAEYVFDNDNTHADGASEEGSQKLRAKIGEVTMEKDLLSKALRRDQ